MWKQIFRHFSCFANDLFFPHSQNIRFTSCPINQIFSIFSFSSSWISFHRRDFVGKNICFCYSCFSFPASSYEGQSSFRCHHQWDGLNGAQGAQETLIAPRGRAAQGDPPAANACWTLTGWDVSAKMAPLCLNTQIDLFLLVLLCIQAVSLRNMFFPVHPDACLAAPTELLFVLQICLTYCFSLVCTFICLPVSTDL